MNKQEIRFTTGNGNCPSFIYNDIKYYIQDKNISNKWCYSLNSRKIGYISKNSRDGYAVLRRFFRGKKYKVKMIGDIVIYTYQGKEFMANKHNISIIYDSEFIAGTWDSYLDCLNYAKKYLAELIDRTEHKQLNLF